SCRMIYSEKESMAATFLFAIAISPIAMTFIIMSETYFTFFLVFAFYFFMRFWKSGKNYFLLLSYFLFCFATIIRPLTYYLALLFTLILIFYFLKKSF